MGKYNQDNFSGMGDEDKMAYDLRQTNAQIITIHWVKVCQSRHDYREWFNNLRFFYTVLKHNVKESRMKGYMKDFKDLREEFLVIINDHPEVYAQKRPDSKVQWLIQEKLLELEERLTDEITQSEMKGTNYVDSGL